MRVFPFRTYRLLVSSSSLAVSEAVSREISRSLLQPPREGTPAFAGRFSEKEFEIQRINMYRSAYMPFIRGILFPRENGTLLQITMRPHRQVIVFSTIWFLFLTLFAAIILSASLDGNTIRLLFLAIPLGLAVSSWLLIVQVFESECRWAAGALDRFLLAGLPYTAAGEEGWPGSVKTP